MKNNFIKNKLIVYAEKKPYNVAIREIKNEKQKEITYLELMQRIKHNKEKLCNKENKIIVVYLSSTIESHIFLYSCFYYGIVPLIRTYNYDFFKKDKLVDDFNTICDHYTDVYKGYIVQENNEFLVIEELENPKYNVTCDLSNIAFIQMTSGTTGFPKAIKSSYKSLNNNLIKCQDYWNLNTTSKILSWLPISHNFGFITSILLPIFTGTENIIISPKYFYQNPVQLLSLFSIYKITHTFLPNFALDYIRINIKDGKNLNLDLSNLKVIGIGGDFITKIVIDNFYKTLKEYGLNYKAFKAVYGMSENSGPITMTQDNEKIDFYNIKENKCICPNEYKIPNTDINITDVGKIYKNDSIIIEFNDELINKELYVGEIIISTNSLFDGYLYDKTIDKNQNNLILINGKKYYKTGDIGFTYNSHLYVLGRKKDIIVIRGKNFSSNIIEEVISKALSIQNISIVVLSVNNDEELYVLIETSDFIFSEEQAIIKTKIIETLKDKFDFGIKETNIIIIRDPLPRTNTNKINRQECKKLIIEGV